jgi:superfamily II DNA or RNA helicase
MFDAFRQYEEEFNDWILDGYPGVNDKTREFIENLSQKLWRHQRKAILRVIYAYEIKNMKNLLLNIVTGGGKTAIIGAVIAWLKYAQNINKFLIIVPNLIVKDRLEADFKDKDVFMRFNFFPDRQQDYLNELDLHIMGDGAGPQGIMDSGIILGNVQQLYSSNISGDRNLAYIKNYIGDVAIFNDEAHNTPAIEYSRILSTLSDKCKFRLDTTATPDRADGQTPDTNMIFHYDIAQALEDKIIKSVVVYQPEAKIVELTYTNNDTGEKKVITELDVEFEEAEKKIKPFQWILDPEPMKKQIAIAIKRLEEQKIRAKNRYKPVLFVVTMSISEGERAKKMLEDYFKLNALLVTEDSEDKERKEARNIGKMDSPYGSVVSVMMLREGWDVPEVSVILLLRKFSSPVYGQQVIGRGLRRIIRDKIEPEILAVVDHPRLQHEWLWRLVAVSKIRQNVLVEDMYGDEDLPERPKIQKLVSPEKLIVIPEPEYKPSIDIAKIDQETKEESVVKDWQKVLDNVVYDKQSWRITKTKIMGVSAITLDKNKTMEILKESIETNGGVNFDSSKLSDDDLRELVKREILNLSSVILMDSGYSGLSKGILYSTIMDHIKKKIFNGKSLKDAERLDMEYIIDNMNIIKKTFSRPIVRGILGGD